MNIVGLTGGIATGKTTVSHYFSDLGVPIIDADIINRQLISPQQQGYAEILKAFPNIPLLHDKSLDKKYLRNKIFNDKNSKQLIENILHPLIKGEIKHQIEMLNSHSLCSYCIVSVPLMIETNFLELISVLWVCDCTEETQLNRLTERDHISKHDAQLIMSHQLSRKERLSYADDIISTENNSHMVEKIKYLHQEQIKLNSN